MSVQEAVGRVPAVLIHRPDHQEFKIIVHLWPFRNWKSIYLYYGAAAKSIKKACAFSFFPLRSLHGKGKSAAKGLRHRFDGKYLISERPGQAPQELSVFK